MFIWIARSIVFRCEWIYYRWYSAFMCVSLLYFYLICVVFYLLLINCESGKHGVLIWVDKLWFNKKLAQNTQKAKLSTYLNHRWIMNKAFSHIHTKNMSSIARIDASVCVQFSVSKNVFRKVEKANENNIYIVEKCVQWM